MRLLLATISAVIVTTAMFGASNVGAAERVCWLNGQSDRLLTEAECAQVRGAHRKACIIRGQADPLLTAEQCDTLNGDWVWVRKGR
jgi:hypothetical protein